MAFGFGRKKQLLPAVGQSPPRLDLRQDGVGFADVTTREAVDDAVAAGRLERFWIMSPQFGGPEVPENQLPGPPGAVAAREWIDDQIIAVLERGGTVSGGGDMDYGDSGSWVPRRVTYDFGPAVGVHTLLFW